MFQIGHFLFCLEIVNYLLVHSYESYYNIIELFIPFLLLHLYISGLKVQDGQYLKNPWATAPTPTAYTDEANDFKFLLGVHKYCLFPAIYFEFSNFTQTLK